MVVQVYGGYSLGSLSHLVKLQLNCIGNSQTWKDADEELNHCAAVNSQPEIIEIHLCDFYHLHSKLCFFSWTFQTWSEVNIIIFKWIEDVENPPHPPVSGGPSVRRDVLNARRPLGARVIFKGHFGFGQDEDAAVRRRSGVFWVDVRSVHTNDQEPIN